MCIQAIDCKMVLLFMGFLYVAIFHSNGGGAIFILPFVAVNSTQKSSIAVYLAGKMTLYVHVTAGNE